MPTPSTTPGFQAAAHAFAGRSLSVIGDASALEHRLTAFLCSRRTPPGVVVAAHDWARAARDAGVPVISGFQSPLERDALRFLLRGRQPVVVCMARRLSGTRVPHPWRTALEERRLLIVADAAAPVRTSARSAELRNRLVCHLAGRVLIAHATPGGRLAGLVAELVRGGRPLFTFDDPGNADLRMAGARSIVGSLEDTPRDWSVHPREA
jgi:hypothetical protein